MIGETFGRRTDALRLLVAPLIWPTIIGSPADTRLAEIQKPDQHMGMAQNHLNKRAIGEDATSGSKFRLQFLSSDFITSVFTSISTIITVSIHPTATFITQRKTCILN